MILSDSMQTAALVARAAREAAAKDEPAVLGYHPVARINPFQALLYTGLLDHGIAPLAIDEFDDWPALVAAAAFGAEPIFHLHWTSEIIADASTATEASERVERALESFRSMNSSGVRLVWTIHNVLPHRCAYPEAEVRLRRGLADLAEAIHVMNPDTTEAVSDRYEIPADKVFYSPHPSYGSAYPHHHDKAQLRMEAGLSKNDFAVALIGAIAPYKGIERLVSALTSIDSPNVTAIVAGTPATGPAGADLVALLDNHPAVRTVARRLSPDEIAQIVTVADAIALPYEATLNSGVATLAVSFGVPIIAPDVTPFRALAARGLCLTYDPAEPDGLERALLHGPAFSTQYDAGAAQELSDATAPVAAGALFASGLRSKLAGKDA